MLAGCDSDCGDTNGPMRTTGPPCRTFFCAVSLDRSPSTRSIESNHPSLPSSHGPRRSGATTWHVTGGIGVQSQMPPPKTCLWATKGPSHHTHTPFGHPHGLVTSRATLFCKPGFGVALPRIQHRRRQQPAAQSILRGIRRRAVHIVSRGTLRVACVCCNTTK